MKKKQNYWFRSKVITSRYIYQLKEYLLSLNIYVRLLIVFLLLTLFVSLLLINRLPLNTRFADLPIGLKTITESQNLIGMKIDEFINTPIEFSVGSNKYYYYANDLGISIDKAETLKSAESLYSFKAKFDSVIGLLPVNYAHLTTKYSVDYRQIAIKIGEINAIEGKTYKNASVTLKNNLFEVQEETDGIVINETAGFSNLKTRVENLSNEPIILDKYTSKPIVNIAGAQKALERIKRLSQQKILLLYNNDSWVIENEKLLALVRFTPRGHSDSFISHLTFFPDEIFITDINDQGRERELEVSLSNEDLDSYLETIGETIDRSRVDATLKFENGKVFEFKPAVDGQILDRAKAKEIILSKISIENSDVAGTISLNLPVSIDHARIANDEVNSLGISELIASGVSYFAGSIPNRAFNVGLGASRLSGTLIKPGDIFSFNQSVGEVSGATGYKRAYVISEGRTVLDDGGGICQVSTTVFRASLNGGLPILARTAHAYRVGYYEQGGFKAGMDATVWSPSVDFKFKNDTSNYILIQAIVDSKLAKLQVDIYGTRDGRRVEMSEAQVSNIVPALPDKHQDDPTLPKGTIKQVDFSAQGATSIFHRKVFKGTETVINESIKSVYRPWQAIFLDGTG